MRRRFGHLVAFWLLASPVLAASAPPATNQPIQVFFNDAYATMYEDNEAIGRSDPDSPARHLLSVIASATSSLDVCVFDISDPDIVAALVAASKRHVKVRIVTDSDNTVVAPLHPARRESIRALERARIPIVEDGRRPFMHHKFMVVDHIRVWLGSMNFTRNALYRDNNNSLLIASRDLARDFETEFHRLFVEHIFDSSSHVIPHPVLRIGDARVRLYFSPGGGARDGILSVVKKAQRSVHLLAFTFTVGPLADLLAEKHDDGVDVEAVFEACQIDAYSAFRTLKKRGVKVWTDGNQALLHHKVVVVDGRYVVTGSFNFTQAAEARNNENMLIIDSSAIARQYEAEFTRLRRGAKEHTYVPPYDHPACGHGATQETP